MTQPKTQSVDSLIERLKERLQYVPAIQADAHCEHTYDLRDRPPGPTLSLAEIEYVESQLGFELPTLVRRLALEVADGRYGPGWGINRLKHPANLAFGPWFDIEMSVESWHRLYCDEKECPPELMTHYPEKFVRYCEIGCNGSICVDCTTQAGILFKDDPLASDISAECLTPLDETLEQWLWSWLDDSPWPKAKYR